MSASESAVKRLSQIICNQEVIITEMNSYIETVGYKLIKDDTFIMRN